MEEIWKPVPSLHGVTASSLGRIKLPELVDPVLLKAREIYKQGFPSSLYSNVDNGIYDGMPNMIFLIKAIKAGMEMKK